MLIQFGYVSDMDYRISICPGNMTGKRKKEIRGYLEKNNFN